jgi:hypothetical protein
LQVYRYNLEKIKGDKIMEIFSLFCLISIWYMAYTLHKYLDEKFNKLEKEIQELKNIKKEEK